MPSPVGHFLGGAAIGLLANARAGWQFAALCGVAAALPDADFLFAMRHRGPSHSLGAAAIVFAAAFAIVFVWQRRQDALRVSLALGLAYASHVLFDWLGADTSNPRGLMALWPFTTSYYISDLDVFNSIDRRYWLEGFWWRNAVAVAREVAIVGPITALAWWATRRRRSSFAR